MSQPLRARKPGKPPTDLPTAGQLVELVKRAREQAEAEAAVGAVMLREDQKSARRRAQAREQGKAPPLRAMLLAALLLFNGYVWLGNPQWLLIHQPDEQSIDYYRSSWKVAVYMQRQRIEEYRRRKGHLPTSAQQAGPPVAGVTYSPGKLQDYQLAAGSDEKQVVYQSTDSLRVLMGRTLLQMGLVTGGAR